MTDSVVNKRVMAMGRASVGAAFMRNMRRFVVQSLALVLMVSTLSTMSVIRAPEAKAAYTISNTDEVITTTGGGGYITANCNTGSIIRTIGATGSSATPVLTRPTADCFSLNAQETLANVPANSLGTTSWGGAGDSPLTSVSCTESQGVVGVVAHKTASNGWISGWQIICGDLLNSTNRTTSATVMGWQNAGTASPGQRETITCPTGMFAVGLSAYVGSILDRIGFKCGAFTVAPGAPTVTSVIATGTTSADISFSAPVSNGGGTITSYTATSTPGGITGSLSQAGSGTISVSGLTPGTSYTFTVTATNSVGTSSASSESSSVTTYKSSFFQIDATDTNSYNLSGSTITESSNSAAGSTTNVTLNSNSPTPAFSFGGSSYITFSNNVKPNVTYGASIQFVAKIAASAYSSGSWPRVMSFGESAGWGSGRDGISVEIGQYGSIEFYMYRSGTSGGYTCITGSNAVVTDAYAIYSIQVGTNKCYISVNGVSKSASAGANAFSSFVPQTSTTWNSRIATMSTGLQSPFSGQIRSLIVSSGTKTSNSVVFMPNGGTGYTSSQIGSSSVTLNSNQFTRSGYTFSNWNTKADGTGTDYANGAAFDLSTSSIALYAQWITATQSITYAAGTGGSGSAPTSPSTVSYGSTFTTPANTFTRTGYTFAGWTDGTNTYAAGATYPSSGSVSANVTLTATWTGNPQSITYAAGTSGSGSAPTSPTTVSYGSTFTTPANTYTRNGYYFTGWSDSSNTYAAGATYPATGTVSGNVTLTAQWTSCGSSVVQTGLLVHLDAANTCSTTGSTTTWKDISTNGNDATLQNTPTYEGTLRGKYYSFGSGGTLNTSSTGKHATLPSGFANFTNGFSVSFFANFTGANNGENILSLGNRPSSFANEISLYRSGTGNQMSLYFQDANKFCNSPLTFITNGVMNHYAVTFSTSNGCKYYKNGVLISTDTTFNVAPSNINRTVNALGRSVEYNSTSYWGGNLGDFALYSAELTAADIASNYQAQADATYTVTYNGNGNSSGSVPTDSSSPYVNGSSVTALANSGTLAKTGYIFAGWCSVQPSAGATCGSVSGTSYTAGSGTFTIGTSNVTLYAIWTALSNVATLSALTLSSGTLSPTFASGTTSYAALVANSVATGYTVTPTVTQANATVVQYLGSTGTTNFTGALSVGENVIRVVVTAQDGTTTSTYTITVTRASNDATLSALTISSGTLSPTFASGTTSYTASVAYSVATGFTFTPTVTQANATTVQYLGSTGTTSFTGALSVGSNVIRVVVTAQDGTTKATYTVTVTRSQPSTNSDLLSLTFSDGTLLQTFASATTSYNLSLPNSVSSITITPVSSSSVATINVNGSNTVSGTASIPVSIIVGLTSKLVVVTAEDGTTKVYTITVTRAPPTWLVAAAGTRAIIFTPTATNVTNLDNGNYFYFGGGGSMGFSPNSSISQNSADTSDTSCSSTTAKQRLSWHYGSGIINSGWRAGCQTGSQNRFQRAIYQSNSLPSYYPSGPQTDVTTSSIESGGWSLCWVGRNSETASMTSIQSVCTGTYLLLAGGYMVNSIYNKNDGTGTTSTVAVPFDTAMILTTNTFTRTGYTFAGWTQYADGTGTAYTNSQANVFFTTDKNFYAKWAPNITLTFNKNDGSGTSTTQVMGMNLNTTLTLNTFTRTGYTFLGWAANTDGSGTSYTNGQSASFGSDTTIYAKWIANVTVTFDKNTGDGSTATQSIQPSVSRALTSNSFSNPGYYFIGWTTNADGSGTSYSNAQSVILTSNLQLYAKWGAITYTVTFDATTNGGTAISPLTLTFTTGNSPLTLPSPVSRSGYSELGWYITSSSGKIGDAGASYSPVSAAAGSTSAVTYYFRWAALTSRTISINAGSYTSTYSMTATPPTITSTPSAGPTDGTKSYSTSTSSVCAINSSTGVVSFVTAGTCSLTSTISAGTTYASATSSSVSFTVSLATQTVTWSPTLSLSATASPATPSAVASALGSATISYSVQSAGTTGCTVNSSTAVLTFTAPGSCTVRATAGATSTYAAGTVDAIFVISAATLSNASTPSASATAGTLKSIAVTWTAVTNASSYTLKFYANDGTTLHATITGLSGTSRTITTTDYSSLADNTAYKVSITAIGTGNYATSSESSKASATTASVYTLTYNYDNATSGNSDATSSFITGGSALTLPVPARTGYTFDGWYEASDLSGTKLSSTYSPTQSRTVYAKWVASALTVTYDSQGGSSVTAGTVNTGSNLTAPTAPTKAGYTFSGWSTSSTGSVVSFTGGYAHGQTASFTLYAIWSANALTITYNSNGGTAVADGTVNTGANISAAPSAPTKTGYTLSGWSATDGGSVISFPYTHGQTSNFTLYAIWSANALTVTYNSNGGSVVTSGSTTSGASIGSAPTAPTRSGYSFAGWSDTNGGSAITFPYAHGQTANFTLYAIWTGSTYTVTYVYNSATSGNSTVSDSFTSGLTAITLPTPARTGYTFLGWYSESGFTNLIGNGGASYSPSGATLTLSLYAKWNINTYAIVFNANNGTGTMANQAFTHGEAANLNANLYSRANYVFYRWATAADGTGTTYSNIAQVTLTAGATLYAQWTANTYVVTYTYNGASGGNSTSTDSFTTAGSPIVLPTPTKTGYTFAGWYSDSGLSSSIGSAGANYSPTGATLSLNAYAKWTAINYTFTYDANSADSGSVPTETSKQINQTATVKANTGSLVRTGYTFGGWNTQSNGSGTNYLSGSIFTLSSSNVTLYAKWSANTYTVAYNFNSGSGSAQRSASNVSSDDYTTGGSAISLPAVGTLQRAGYTFGGWNTSAAGTGTNYATADSYTTVSNTTLYAKWNAITYAISYNGNTSTGGTSPTTGGYTTGQASPYSVASNTFTKTLHVFGGWNTAANGSGTNYSPGSGITTLADVVLYAIWIPQYTLHYAINGGSVTSGSLPSDTLYNAGTSIGPLFSSVSRTGYTFGGWLNGSTTIAANGSFNIIEDSVLTAIWTPINYTISYNSDGGTEAPASVTKQINQSHTVGSAPSKPGYNFNGWSNGSSVVGAGAIVITGASDVTYTAQWVPKVYTVSYDWNGGRGTAVSDVNYTFGTTAITLPTVGDRVKDGYTFAGWSESSNGSALNSTYIPSQSRTLYALWNVGNFTVTYDAGRGTIANSSVPVANGSSTVLPLPTRANFTFDGWHTLVSGGSRVGSHGDSFTPASSQTVYARWIQNSLYGITNSLSRIGSVVTSSNIANTFSGANSNSSVVVSVPANALPAGTTINFDLVSDSTRATGIISNVNYLVSIALSWLTGDETVPDTASDKPISVTISNASIKKGAAAYAIVNNVSTLLGTATQDGTITVSITADPEIVIAATRPGAPTNIAATSNGNQQSVIAWDAPTSDGGSVITGYTVTANTGATCSTSTTSCTISSLANGTAYTFTVTATNTVGTSTASSAASATTAALYTVVFDAKRGSSVSNGSFFTASTVSEPTAPTRSGYTFAGWSATDGGSAVTFPYAPGVTTNITLYALWSASNHVVTFNSNSGSAVTDGSYASGGSVTEPTAPTRSGYTFAGWSATDGGSAVTFPYSPGVVTDITLYAKWTAVSQSSSGGGGGGSSGGSATPTPTEPSTPVVPAKSNVTVVPPITVIGDQDAKVVSVEVNTPKPGTDIKPVTIKVDSVSEKFIAEAKVVEGKLVLTPVTGFSGKKTVTVTITENGADRIVQIPLTVLPEVVEKPVFTPASATKTIIRWTESPNADAYTVYLNGKKVCSTQATSCSIAQVLGPDAKVEIISNGGDRTVSEKVEADFKQTTAVSITRLVSATNIKTTLSSVDTKALDKVIALIKNQGFGTVVISDISSTNKTKAKADARIAAIKKYIDAKTGSEKITFEVVPAAGRTYFNNIAVKG